MVARGRTIQPPASNMKQMFWDNELAAVAQRWADQCQVSYLVQDFITRWVECKKYSPPI